MIVKQLGIVFLLSAAMASAGRSQTVTPMFTATPAGAAPAGATPAAANGAAPFFPSQVQQAYGLNLLQSGSGAGQTIAIIDAYNYPGALTTINSFSSTFGLPQFNQPGGPTFTQLNQAGGTTLPGIDNVDGAAGTAANWEFEEALDMEWAHAMAPNANIILYEAYSAFNPYLYQAVSTAASNPNVSVVSMSWGGSESLSNTASNPVFTTPSAKLSAKQGVTFLAAAGDDGAPGVYPAYSPNVVAVGGTSLYLTLSGAYSSETAWGSSTNTIAGGGGVSSAEPKPSFQQTSSHGSVLATSSSRAIPDVSMVADLNTGVYVYDSYNGGWWEGGGTSLSAQCWAGLIADADGIRSLAGNGTLDGPSQTLPALYGLPNSDFNDVTTGSNATSSNPGYPAGPGYDLATGLGTPMANTLVPDLANYQVVPEPSAAALLGIAATVAIGRVLGRRLRRQSRRREVPMDSLLSAPTPAVRRSGEDSRPAGPAGRGGSAIASARGSRGRPSLS